MKPLIFLFLFFISFSGRAVNSLSYDYSASSECLAEPLRPQYGGGILINSEFNNGLEGWSVFAHADAAHKISKTGNKFAVAHSREKPYHSLSQKVFMDRENLYTFSAWVQTSVGESPVTVSFKTSTGFIHAGAVVAQSGCWSMLKGGLAVETSGTAEFYFESNNTTAEIWIDSVSLQPFTKEQWRSHQAGSIEKVRKQRVRINVVDFNNRTIPGAKISIQQNRPGFPFGNAISKTILGNNAYQSWFTSRFTVTTFEDEMKWYSNEGSQGKMDYSNADAMLAFCKQHNIQVRGHNIFWEDPHFQQGWLKSLNGVQLQAATDDRINSIVNRYKGQLIAWDVVNENLHFNFFESKLGNSASSVFYQKTQQLDGTTLMFMNEFNTLEEPGDGASTPAKYLQKLKEIQGSLANGVQMAIGLESHFKQPNIPYMRSALDTLAGANVPIWLTEVDVSGGPNQEKYLEDILREAYSHPAVKGIVMWASWHPEGCYRMCLTDNNFKNLPTGNVVDKLIGEWKSSQVVGTADINGFFEADLLHGEYEIRAAHAVNNSASVQRLKIDAENGSGTTIISVIQP